MSKNGNAFSYNLELTKGDMLSNSLTTSVNFPTSSSSIAAATSWPIFFENKTS